MEMIVKDGIRYRPEDAERKGIKPDRKRRTRNKPADPKAPAPAADDNKDATPAEGDEAATK